MNIEIPEWAKLGNIVLVKDITCERGENNKDEWYPEYIVGYSDTGVFTKCSKCPIYHYKFTDYPKYIKRPDKDLKDININTVGYTILINN